MVMLFSLLTIYMNGWIDDDDDDDDDDGDGDGDGDDTDNIVCKC